MGNCCCVFIPYVSILKHVVGALIVV